MMVPLHRLIRHLDFVDAQGCSVISCLLLNSKSIKIGNEKKRKELINTKLQEINMLPKFSLICLSEKERESI